MGRFITVEGGEGVGKSLFCKKIEKHLNKKGVETLLTREPGGGPLGADVRKWLQDPNLNPSSKTELLLVSAARIEHIRQLILPFVEKNGVVICDRYMDSTRIYQGVLGGVDTVWVESVIQQTIQGLEPEVTFLLDCPVDIAMKRMESRGCGKSRFDAQSAEQHECIRQGFLDLAHQYSSRIKLIDASRSPEYTLAQAVAHLEVL
ncbi:MAG: dTMP kinase [Oligoflexales bacterium]